MHQQLRCQDSGILVVRARGINPVKHADACAYGQTCADCLLQKFGLCPLINGLPLYSPCLLYPVQPPIFFSASFTPYLKRTAWTQSATSRGRILQPRSKSGTMGPGEVSHVSLTNDSASSRPTRTVPKGTANVTFRSPIESEKKRARVLKIAGESTTNKDKLGEKRKRQNAAM